MSNVLLIPITTNQIQIILSALTVIKFVLSALAPMTTVYRVIKEITCIRSITAPPILPHACWNALMATMRMTQPKPVRHASLHVKPVTHLQLIA